jgi:excisionase family DNA binding protein
MQREFLNIKQVQEMLGISERTAFRYIKSGELKGFKVGREWKFEPADIDAFIELRRQKAEQELKGDNVA